MKQKRRVAKRQPNQKAVPHLLTPDEIASLQQDKKESIALMRAELARQRQAKAAFAPKRALPERLAGREFARFIS